MSESTTIEGIAYGPLASLVGVWTGEKGLDIAPEPGGQDMSGNAKTIAFHHKIAVSGDTLIYDETVEVDIYGSRFNHTDENTLTRR